jgi:hypothetical protein
MICLTPTKFSSKNQHSHFVVFVLMCLLANIYISVIWCVELSKFEENLI